MLVPDQAEKELFNVASKTMLPKVERKEVSYFQPEQVAAVREGAYQVEKNYTPICHYRGEEKCWD